MKFRLASIDEVPEDRGLLVEAGSKAVAVFRYNGEFFAVDDTCPHKGGSLHEGPNVEGVVSCPWHQWQFDLRTGACPINPLSKIETYRVWAEGNDLFIEI
jgi:nitrite reductase/ring-hydroxylating ferredoxin subunit